MSFVLNLLLLSASDNNDVFVCPSQFLYFSLLRKILISIPLTFPGYTPVSLFRTYSCTQSLVQGFAGPPHIADYVNLNIIKEKFY